MVDRNFGRILVIGDIHGCALALRTLLHAVQPQPGDIVITLGDYIDRGPESYQVLEILIALYKQGLLIPLRGNHDMLFLLNCIRPDNGINFHHHLFTEHKLSSPKLVAAKIRMSPLAHLWKGCGSTATINAYRRANSHGSAFVPARHFHFLEHDCLNLYETDEYIFVHGGVSSDIPANDTEVQVLYGKRTNHLTEPRHCSGKKIICGHTVQKNGVIGYGKNAVCLDTGVFCGGWLSCLEMNSEVCVQANERGVVRKFSYR